MDVRCVDSSTLVFRVSSHRNPYIVLSLALVLTIHSKQRTELDENLVPRAREESPGKPTVRWLTQVEDVHS